MEKKHTESGKSYWNSNAAYQKEYTELYEKLVPDTDQAETVHGELLRAASRLTYDYYNNGNCNVISKEEETETRTCYACDGDGEVDGDEEDSRETCRDCFGSGEIEDISGYEITIEEYYQKMIDFLDKHLQKKEVIVNLLKFLCDYSKGYGRYTYKPDEEKVYVQLMDEVMYHILTTENAPR